MHDAGALGDGASSCLAHLMRAVGCQGSSTESGQAAGLLVRTRAVRGGGGGTVHRIPLLESTWRTHLCEGACDGVGGSEALRRTVGRLPLRGRQRPHGSPRVEELLYSIK